MKDELLTTHLNESFLLPFIEYARYIKASIIKQIGQVIHLHFQHLYSMQRRAESADKMNEASFKLLSVDAPHVLVLLLNLTAKLIEEVHAKHLIPVQLGIDILLVYSKYSNIASCRVCRLERLAFTKKRIRFNDRRVLNHLLKGESTELAKAHV